jgi:hypothetical protein
LVVQVYHVEVKVNDGLKAHVTAATKITRKLPDRLPGAKFPHPKFDKQPRASSAQQPAAVNATPQQPAAADADATMGEAAADDEGEGEGGNAQAAREEADAASADVAAAQAELAAAQDEAKRKLATDLVKIMQLRQETKEANARRLAAREELLGADVGLLDTIRHHFYRVSQWAATLKGTVAEIQKRARDYWRDGLLGHVYFQTHSHCCDDAEVTHSAQCSCPHCPLPLTMHLTSPIPHRCTPPPARCSVLSGLLATRSRRG